VAAIAKIKNAIVAKGSLMRHMLHVAEANSAPDYVFDRGRTLWPPRVLMSKNFCSAPPKDVAVARIAPQKSVAL
jgi:hypothetical protein